MKDYKFNHGDKVKEKIAGFTGIVTGRADYMTGCNQYAITAESENNKEPITLWYDEGRIELLEEEVFKKDEVQAEKDGCDIAPPMGKRGM